jgi:hypothetical protein
MTFYKSWQRKYHNKPQVVDGIRYDSGLEGNRANELALLEKAKEIKSWVRQITLPLWVNGLKITSYRMDFIVYENDGSITLEECKGMEMPLWKMKWTLLEALLSQDCEGRDIIYEIIGATKNTEVRMSLIK